MASAPNQYDLVLKLTSETLPEADRTRTLNDFASNLGWHPSDRLIANEVSEFANNHLLVEHGLENTAVITFLRHPNKFSNLSYSEKKTLLTISYNNLVDWHIQVHNDEVVFVFNRTDPPSVVGRFDISRDSHDKLQSYAFEQISGKSPSSNLPALDEALISTISYWKRNLSAELKHKPSLESLSALFNTIIFVRATEDNYRRLNFDKLNEVSPSQALIDAVNSCTKDSLNFSDIVFSTLKRFALAEIPSFLVDKDKLRAFDTLEKATALQLFTDFYRNKFAPYRYDFSLMSKHALSRIYEHYVSILRLEESNQMTFFPQLPEEKKDKSYGNIYTPQFIARFFARYLKEQYPPSAFRKLSVADPACGSGIFLRTLLELQCDPTRRRKFFSVNS